MVYVTSFGIAVGTAIALPHRSQRVALDVAISFDPDPLDVSITPAIRAVSAPATWIPRLDAAAGPTSPSRFVTPCTTYEEPKHDGGKG